MPLTVLALAEAPATMLVIAPAVLPMGASGDALVFRPTTATPAPVPVVARSADTLQELVLVAAPLPAVPALPRAPLRQIPKQERN